MTSPRILQAEQIDHSVMITFDDGRAALFPAVYLYAHIHEVEEVLEDGTPVRPSNTSSDSPDASKS
jgi:hypothetical protein